MWLLYRKLALNPESDFSPVLFPRAPHCHLSQLFCFLFCFLRFGLGLGGVTKVLGSFHFVLTVPEPTKTCSSQPQPAGTGTSTPTSTLSSSSNGKRAPAGGQQPAVSRYLPREVPPRFRQQEQKQLLKRGQPLPTGALTSASPTQAAGPAGVSPPPLPGAGAQQQPSKLQPGEPRRAASHLGLVCCFPLGGPGTEMDTFGSIVSIYI